MAETEGCPVQMCSGSGVVQIVPTFEKCLCVEAGERKKMFEERYTEEYIKILKEVFNG